MRRPRLHATRETLAPLTATALLATVATFVAGSGTALADDDEGHIVRKIRVIETDGQASHVVSEENTFFADEGHAIEVRMDDGDVVVRVDGEEVPAGRVIQKDGHITILDGEGNEIRRIGIGRFGPGDHVMEFRFGEGENRFWVAGDNTFVADEPKVMLGIHLGVPGPALERHLHLEPGTSTMVSALLEGLPAHAAGLGEFDIITRIDGDGPADPTSLRTSIAAHEPGDVVRLTVIQEGDEREVTVTVEAFDRAAMSEAKLIGRSGANLFFAPGLDGSLPGKLRFGGAGAGAVPFGEVEDLDRFFLDDENRVFEMLPRGHLEWREDTGSDGPLDQRLRRLDRRLAGLEELLDDLLEEAKRERGR